MDEERQRKAGVSRVLAVRTAVRVTVLSVAGELVSCSTAQRQGCLFLYLKVQNTNLLLSCSLPGEPQEETTQAASAALVSV